MNSPNARGTFGGVRAALLLFFALPTRADILLSEVYYGHVGADGSFEWIELVNTGVTPVDLTGYQIGAGGVGYTYSVTTLSGTIGACETFVIGVNSVPENGAPTIDLGHGEEQLPQLRRSGPSPPTSSRICTPCDRASQGVRLRD